MSSAAIWRRGNFYVEQHINTLRMSPPPRKKLKTLPTDTDIQSMRLALT